MSKDWTPEELQAASAAMRAKGLLGYEGFAAAIGKYDELISEESAKEIAGNIGAVQRDEVDNERICPRCGKETMHRKAAKNALSRHADVYICPDCGMQEALMETAGLPPLPFSEWAGVKEYVTTVWQQFCDGMLLEQQRIDRKINGGWATV